MRLFLITKINVMMIMISMNNQGAIIIMNSVIITPMVISVNIITSFKNDH